MSQTGTIVSEMVTTVSQQDTVLDLLASRLKVRLLRYLAAYQGMLRSYYGQIRGEIAAILSQILELRALRVSHGAVLHEAMALFGQHNVGFIDAHHAAAMRRRGIEAIFSHDQDFDRLGVRREEP